MDFSQKRILIYGYGNSTREDDGLGIEFVKKIEKWIKKNNIQGFSFEINTQLNIEDTELIKDKDIVFFIDATNESIKDFKIKKIVHVNSKNIYTMHKINPSIIVEACNKIYKKFPIVYLLYIKGYKWSLKETISNKANKNLNIALNFFKNLLKKRVDLISLDKYCT